MLQSDSFCSVVFCTFLSFCISLAPPCRRLSGRGDKQQPIVQYKPQRSYNRSAVEITRMFLRRENSLVCVCVCAVPHHGAECMFIKYLVTEVSFFCSEEPWC